MFALAVGLVKIENLIRYTERAVGLKPSARQGEARLRGLFQTTRHPCASVLSVPIRVLFRRSGAGAPVRVRADGD